MADGTKMTWDTKQIVPARLFILSCKSKTFDRTKKQDPRITSPEISKTLGFTVNGYSVLPIPVARLLSKGPLDLCASYSQLRSKTKISKGPLN